MLNRAEAARRLHVSKRTVRRWAKAGLLDERRVGPRVVLVTEDSVTARLSAGKKEAA
jgi:excisionase family DNA binding protein